MPKQRITCLELVTCSEIVAIEGATSCSAGWDICKLDESNFGLARDGLDIDIAWVSVATRHVATKASQKASVKLEQHMSRHSKEATYAENKLSSSPLPTPSGMFCKKSILLGGRYSSGIWTFGRFGAGAAPDPSTVLRL